MSNTLSPSTLAGTFDRKFLENYLYIYKTNEAIKNKPSTKMSLLPSSFLNHICSPASILQSPFYHRLCCFTLDTPSRPHGALEMSFCKRSDVVGYANTPSQALLLTEVSCHFSKKKKQKKHLHTITTRQKVRKDTHLKNSNGHLHQFLAGVKQTLHVSSCINIYI